jgi:ribosomal protein S11
MKLKKIKKNNLKLKKKSHFFFRLRNKKRRGNLYLSRSRTNYFITFTDLKKRVVKSFSTGSVALGPKRKAMSPYTVEKVMRKLIFFIKMYEIKRFYLIIKIISPGHIFAILKELKKHNIVIIRMFNRLPLPHNGVRAQKMPRK